MLTRNEGVWCGVCGWVGVGGGGLTCSPAGGDEVLTRHDSGCTDTPSTGRGADRARSPRPDPTSARTNRFASGGGDRGTSPSGSTSRYWPGGPRSDRLRHQSPEADTVTLESFLAHLDPSRGGSAAGPDGDAASSDHVATTLLQQVCRLIRSRHRLIRYVTAALLQQVSPQSRSPTSLDSTGLTSVSFANVT